MMEIRPFKVKPSKKMAMDQTNKQKYFFMEI